MKKTASKKTTLLFLKRIGFWILGFLCASLLIFSLFLFKEIDTEELHRDPQPLTFYRDAERHISGLKSLDDEEVYANCRTQFLSHGDITERAIILFHGYTSCPKQFEELGNMLFEKGYNVLIPRMPEHGLKDTMTTRFDSVDAKKLILFTNEIIDIAEGMGNKLDIIGISGGAVLTSWAIQNREHINTALIISPIMRYRSIPESFALPAARFATLIPHYYIWWDANKQEYRDGPDYGYARFSVRSLGQFFYIASAVQKQSENTPLKAKKVVFITNQNDSFGASKIPDTLYRNWKKSKTKVQSYEFDAQYELNHDLIDPNQPNAHTDIVYPKLINFLDEK